MFQKGEYVYHESGGICKIDDVCLAPLSGMPADRMYYVLRPLEDRNSVNYVPVDSEGVFVRRLLDREEATALLQQIPTIDEIREPNAKLLRAKYIEAMKTHQPVEWARVLKTVHIRMRAQEGRTVRVSESERNFSENAKKNLLAELSLALEQDQESIACAILKSVEPIEA